MNDTITCVSLEISDDVPSLQRRIPTLVIRNRLGPREVTVVDDTMIVGVPTEPRFVLPVEESSPVEPEPEPEPDLELDPADSALHAITIKHGPNIPAMIAAFAVCFMVSVFGSMMVSIHINQPEPQPIAAPQLPALVDPPVPARATPMNSTRVEPAGRSNTTLTAPQPERSRKVRAPLKKKTERKFDPLRSKVIFRASDI